MVTIDDVASKAKDSTKQVSDELQRSNATKFVDVERAIRLKMEALELRVGTSIEGLHREVSAQVAAFIHSNAAQNGNSC